MDHSCSALHAPTAAARLLALVFSAAANSGSHVQQGVTGVHDGLLIQ